MCVASDNHEADIVALIRSLGQIQHVKALLEKQGKDTSGDISGRY